MLIQLPDQPGWRKPKWVVKHQGEYSRQLRRYPLTYLWWWEDIFWRSHHDVWFEVEV